MTDSVFSIFSETDTYVLILDSRRDASVTAHAPDVVKAIDGMVSGGIGNRRIFYQDSTGRFDELVHDAGEFTGFAPCTNDQQRFFGRMVGQS